MPLFTFSAASEVQRAVKYLCTFDDTVKFTLTSGGSEQRLYLTTANIHPFCYTDFAFQTILEAPPAKRHAAEEAKVCWAINSDLLVRLLGCFTPVLALTIEIGEDSSVLLLLQQSPDAAVTRVMQVGVLHDLGPSLAVDHGIEELYRIADIDGFRQVARSAAVSDDPTCLISLTWPDEADSACFLKIESAAAQFLVKLGTLKHHHRPSSSSSSSAGATLEGRVQCADLETFGLLCERARATSDGSGTNNNGSGSSTAPLQRLSIGFGDSGLSLLRLEWFSPAGESTANLFFCTS